VSVIQISRADPSLNAPAQLRALADELESRADVTHVLVILVDDAVQSPYLFGRPAKTHEVIGFLECAKLEVALGGDDE
jgi:hypothetical protein